MNITKSIISDGINYSVKENGYEVSFWLDSEDSEETLNKYLDRAKEILKEHSELR